MLVRSPFSSGWQAKKMTDVSWETTDPDKLAKFMKSPTKKEIPDVGLVARMWSFAWFGSNKTSSAAQEAAAA